MILDTRTEPPWEAERQWPDSRLVAACLQGNEKAWAALIDKYKNLIFSIPIRYGFSRGDAADIFQAVCLDLLTELPKLRNPAALSKWLMQATAHRCWRSRRREARYSHDEEEAQRVLERAASPEPAPDVLLREVEREQALREAIAALPPRCRRMVELLFFETPARPYSEVAAILGVATGSIGFLRLRCLRRLRADLERAGL